MAQAADLPLHYVVYLSPAGTTRQVADTIAARLEFHQQAVHLIDVAELIRRREVECCFSAWTAGSCLWLGSPVYCDHALPPVTEIISRIPFESHGFAVPFVTWGGVTSGLALPELAEGLTRRGLRVVGAAKVLALHSSTLGSSQPVAAGHPDAEDLRQIRGLVDRVLEKIAGPGPALDAALLHYLPQRMELESQAKSLAQVKTLLPPLVADQDRCLGCGDCVAICPLSCLRLNPWPEADSRCIRCSQCVRGCPHGAFPFNPEAALERIRDMAARSDEEKVTRVFV